MEEQIAVNEYVRTKKGYIDKIINIERYNEEEKWLVGENFRKGLNNGYYGRTTDNDITKHSPNIIDLIEVGDIVVDDFTNEPYKVSKIEQDYIYCNCDMVKLKPNVIKTILTKQQYTENCYEVK